MSGRRIAVRRLGRLGEAYAAWFYLVRGYRIAGRNVRMRSGEIDLVARRGRLVIVVEVKTRQSLSAGEGWEAVDARKRARLIALGDEYVTRHPRARLQLRYDVVSLFWNGWRFVVSHFPDAFRPVADAQQPWKWRA